MIGDPCTAQPAYKHCALAVGSWWIVEWEQLAGEISIWFFAHQQ